MVEDVLTSWTPTNTTTGVPVAKVTNNGGGNFLPSEFYIEDGSFLRIKNIQVGYSLPLRTISKLHISKLRFYASVQNAFTFTKYSGYDPEVSSNTLVTRVWTSTHIPMPEPIR